VGGSGARIGAIVPSINICAEPDFAAMVPNGVTVHATRLALNTAAQVDVRAMAAAAEAAATLLADLEPDFVIFNCTAAAALAEPGLAARVAAAAGCPAGTTADSIVGAAASLGVRRIALVSPYPAELAMPEEEFLVDRGLDVVAHVALAIDDVREWPRIEPERWAELGIAAQAERGAEAVVISCTNIRAREALETIEREAGVPAIASNQAALWGALRAIEVTEPVRDCGRLLAAPRGSALADGATA
jgi:maleate isomerase